MQEYEPRMTAEASYADTLDAELHDRDEVRRSIDHTTPEFMDRLREELAKLGLRTEIITVSTEMTIVPGKRKVCVPRTDLVVTRDEEMWQQAA